MKIHIEDNLYLESDEHQFLLKDYSGKTYTNDKGKEVESYKVIGYYGTINQAINSLLQKKIRESTANNLKELLQEIEKIKRYIAEKIDV